MRLGELIEALEAAPPNHVVPHGFRNPHSYRGYYDQLAFEPCDNITVHDMLAEARSALSSTFTGWKGGEFAMDEHTECWLANHGCCGEEIGPTLLRYMLAPACAAGSERAP